MKHICYPEILECPTIFILGSFDGIHKGHLSLFYEAKRYKNLHPEYQIAVCTFSKPPKNFLQGLEEPSLFTFSERLILFRDLGVDILYELPLDHSFFSLLAKDFLEKLLKLSSQSHFLIGEEARFGSDQQGGEQFFKALSFSSSQWSYDTIDILHDQNEEKIGSSKIKKMVEEGKVQEIASLLFEPFFISGNIIHGNKQGRLIGFPTLNIPYPPHKVLLPFGVYRSFTKIDGLLYHSLTYLSDFRLDTVSKTPLLETWVCHFDKEVYDKEAIVYLLSFHRPPIKVSSLSSLKTLLDEDKNSLSQKMF